MSLQTPDVASVWVQGATDMHSACHNKKQIPSIKIFNKTNTQQLPLTAKKGSLLCHIVLLQFPWLEALEACLEACLEASPEGFCSNFHGLATQEFESCIDVCRLSAPAAA